MAGLGFEVLNKIKFGSPEQKVQHHKVRAPPLQMHLENGFMFVEHAWCIYSFSSLQWLSVDIVLFIYLF